VTFTGYDADGRALGPGPDGLEVRVPAGIRGETAEVKIVHVSPHQPVAWGRLRRLREASPHRLRAPGAPEHVCGGCPWSHLDAEEELRAKREVLEALAEAAPKARLGQPRVLPSPRRQGYRSGAKYVVGHQGPRLVLGGYVPRSHHVVRTVGCPVTDPAVDAAAAVLERLLAEGPWPVYEEQTGQGLLRYVGIRANHAGQLLITLVTAWRPEPARDDDLAPLVQALRAELPELVGVGLDVNDTGGNVIFSGDTTPLWGASELPERYGPARVWLTGHGFGQVNREQAARLYEKAAAAALAPLSPRPGAARTAASPDRPPRQIVELFCGAGALSQVIARQSGSQGPAVLGVERDPRAVALAQRGAREAGLSQLRFEAADARRWLSARPDTAPGPDVVVLDPPRAGCGAPLREALVRSAVRRVVYVSCSPRSLARDLAFLGEAGYCVATLQGFDLMPLTPHLEVLAVLERDPR
jgi:23S rRNA (uracil1939-C5)-methyltransferase